MFSGTARNATRIRRAWPSAWAWRYYSLGKYDEAVKSLLRAADLNPSDPRVLPLFILGV